jgi:spermidine/putrescine transport system substrate-binding protein
MKKIFAAILMVWATGAQAEGQLNIYNWGNYTSPELIEKFEREFDVEVTITDYDSNDTALAKIRQGGHGFDIVVPSGPYVPIFISEGLLLEARPDQMENFRHLDPRWVDVPFDPGRRYTVPWQWGTVGISVNRAIYDGDINTSGILFDPPEPLRGRINIVPEMTDVIGLAIRYVGGKACSDSPDLLKKVRDTLIAAKPHWQSITYGSLEMLTEGDVAASLNWNGASLRARLKNPKIAYGYPREGFPVWSDNVGILADARNVENARAFMNFIMAPQNAALISNFARYANGIVGSEQFMDVVMKNAPEIMIPDELRGAAYVSVACSPDAMRFYSEIWTEVMK